jgi:hypothetical protein
MRFIIYPFSPSIEIEAAAHLPGQEKGKPGRPGIANWAE